MRPRMTAVGGGLRRARGRSGGARWCAGEAGPSRGGAASVAQELKPPSAVPCVASALAAACSISDGGMKPKPARETVCAEACQPRVGLRRHADGTARRDDAEQDAGAVRALGAAGEEHVEAQLGDVLKLALGGRVVDGHFCVVDEAEERLPRGEASSAVCLTSIKENPLMGDQVLESGAAPSAVRACCTARPTRENQGAWPMRSCRRATALGTASAALTRAAGGERHRRHCDSWAAGSISAPWWCWRPRCGTA